MLAKGAKKWAIRPFFSPLCAERLLFSLEDQGICGKLRDPLLAFFTAREFIFGTTSKGVAYDAIIRCP